MERKSPNIYCLGDRLGDWTITALGSQYRQDGNREEVVEVEGPNEKRTVSYYELAKLAKN